VLLCTPWVPMAKSSRLQETLALLNQVDLDCATEAAVALLKPVLQISSILMMEGKFAEVKAVALGLHRQDETLWLWASQATEQKRLFIL
jgi:hypothetical protein